MTELILSATNKTVEFIKKHDIKFHRGDPYEQFLQLSKISYGLTLPIYKNNDELERIIFSKNLYSLWNILVDDEIDRTKKCTNLLESINYLSNESLSESINNKVVKSLFDNIIYSKKNESTIEVSKFDLLNTAQGFFYEYIINKSPILANEVDYNKYSITTINTLPFLNIDYSFNYPKLSEENYINLRIAYNHFTNALKYASDIGSFQREFEVEKNLNLIILKLFKEKILTPEDFLNNKVSYKEISTKISPIITEVKEAAFTELDKGSHIINNLKSIDASIINKTMYNIVKNYSDSIDPFYK